MADTPDILRGTLDLLVLKALSWGPSHGYGVARWVEMATGDALAVGEGTLYPALHRLEERGLVSASGARPRTTVARSSTRSRRLAARSCASRPRTGSATRRPSLRRSRRRPCCGADGHAALDPLPPAVRARPAGRRGRRAGVSSRDAHRRARGARREPARAPPSCRASASASSSARRSDLCGASAADGRRKWRGASGCAEFVQDVAYAVRTTPPQPGLCGRRGRDARPRHRRDQRRLQRRACRPARQPAVSRRRPALSRAHGLSRRHGVSGVRARTS